MDNKVCEKCKAELFGIEKCESDDRYVLITCNDCGEVYGEIKIKE